MAVQSGAMARALLCPAAAVAARYLARDGDAPEAAPIRARLRLCCTALAEHRELRHQITPEQHAAIGAAPTGAACRVCTSAAETVDHVFFHCVGFAVARRACEAALRAEGLTLGLNALCGVGPPAEAELSVAALRATAAFLLAVRARIRV